MVSSIYGIAYKMSQMVPAKKHSRFHSTNKFVKQATNCQNSLKTCLLNQAPASHRLACTWFLKIDPVQIVGVHVCVCVCVSTHETINN